MQLRHFHIRSQPPSYQYAAWEPQPHWRWSRHGQFHSRQPLPIHIRLPCFTHASRGTMVSQKITRFIESAHGFSSAWNGRAEGWGWHAWLAYREEAGRAFCLHWIFLCFYYHANATYFFSHTFHTRLPLPLTHKGWYTAYSRHVNNTNVRRCRHHGRRRRIRHSPSSWKATRRVTQATAGHSQPRADSPPLKIASRNNAAHIFIEILEMFRQHCHTATHLLLYQSLIWMFRIGRLSEFI